MTEITFTVPKARKSVCDEQVAAFNKLAAKHVVNGVTAHATVTYSVPRWVTVERNGFNVEVQYVDVTLTGTDLVFPGGWQLAATLDHDEAGNIFRSNPSFTGAEIPAEFRTSDSTRCDHCGLVRYRTKTVLVWNETDGFRQVGSDCVRLFLGIPVESIIKFQDAVTALTDEDGERYGFHNDEPLVAEFVAAASIVVSLYGFSPVSNHFATPTRSIVTEWLGRPNAYFWKNYPELKEVTPEIKARASKLAADALAWVAAETGNGSDYILNLKLAAARTLVGKNAGLLASLPNAYKRAVEAEAERAAKAVLPDSEFIGSVGDKVTVAAKVVYTNRSEGYTYDSPESLFVILITDKGEKIYTNTTVETVVGKTFEDADKDALFTVTGTVKAHKTTDKGKVTVFTRCKAAAA